MHDLFSTEYNFFSEIVEKFFLSFSGIIRSILYFHWGSGYPLSSLISLPKCTSGYRPPLSSSTFFYISPPQPNTSWCPLRSFIHLLSGRQTLLSCCSGLYLSICLVQRLLLCRAVCLAHDHFMVAALFITSCTFVHRLNTSFRMWSRRSMFSISLSSF